MTSEAGVGRIPELRAVVCAESDTEAACRTVYDVQLYRGGCPACGGTEFVSLAVALRDRGQVARRRGEYVVTMGGRTVELRRVP